MALAAKTRHRLAGCYPSARANTYLLGIKLALRGCPPRSRGVCLCLPFSLFSLRVSTCSYRLWVAVRRVLADLAGCAGRAVRRCARAVSPAQPGRAGASQPASQKPGGRVAAPAMADCLLLATRS
jgi:hypothetical protein